jgi:hypothetical protein
MVATTAVSLAIQARQARAITLEYGNSILFLVLYLNM